MMGWSLACLPAATADDEFAYGPSAEQKVLVCQPKNSRRSNPGVLLLHGGGWIGGKASSFKNRCEFFARAGFVAATVEYRLAGDAARWPAQEDDSRAALDSLRAHARNLNLDADHICVYGESAGGHLALWLGIRDHLVACIVDAFGPTDLTRLDERKFSRAFLALFGASAEMLERRRQASPLFAVSSSLPPILIIQGEADQLVPPEQSTSLAEALVQKNVPTEVIFYRGGHSWLGLDAAGLSAILKHIADFVEAHSKADGSQVP